ncbi:SDR family NAD(P)-dependent oxidoreductase [Pseudomonas putida]
MTSNNQVIHAPFGMAQAGAGNFHGRVVLITGAGRGLGGTIAQHFARAGADVVICDIDMPALEETQKAVEAAGANCLALRCDISSSRQVVDMFAAIVERFGGSSHLRV